jgi:DnaD/phage-associated family protein
MKGFAGFPADAKADIRLPDLFFSELLPDIDHLGELKVTLHVFWLLTRKGGPRPYVSGEELAADRRLLAGLAMPGLSPEEVLRDALDRAVARRTLLRVTTGGRMVHGEQGRTRGEKGQTITSERNWYFVNSEKGRQAVDDLLAGKWTPVQSEQPLHLQSQRPNVFVLYEQNIGPLTPLLAEELMEAEDTYPASWIEDAIREAVELNKRSWRYVQRILERWAAEGKTDEATRRSDERDRRRFIEGEYADYVEH